MKTIRLLESSEKEYFLDCIDELYKTVEANTPNLNIRREQVKYGRLKSYLVRLLIKMPSIFKPKIHFRAGNVINFASMISGDYKLLIPYVFTSGPNYIYMYDVWPRFQYWIFPLLDFFNIRCVFFSSKQVWQSFIDHYPKVDCQSVWIPEALDASAYFFEEYEKKHIDVLEFGRIYMDYHNQILLSLQSKGSVHLYQELNKELLFADKKSFVKGLAASKIVICVPSNITHPDRAEYISTMTLRYLQAMASKCLIVGILPSDMLEIFGYNPIVEIDQVDPGNQIIRVIEEYDTYRPLIERNYQEVISKHQWINRWEFMKEKMEVR